MPALIDLSHTIRHGLITFKGLGIDSHDIDDTRTRNGRPVHSTLLRKEILIVEHLRGLDQLPTRDFTFTAVPPKFKGVGTFPVRAFAQVP